MSEIKISIEMPCMDRLEVLVQRHRDLLRDLGENLSQIRDVRVEIEAKINGSKNERLNG